MKKILLIISEYFSRFFSVVLVGGTLLLFSTLITIPELWMGGGRSGNVFHNNFGSIFLENFGDNYLWFFFFPLLYFVIFFLIISVCLWVFYRNDKKAGAVGFKNVILSLLVLFVLVYFPIRVDSFRFKISQMKADEIAQSGGVIKTATPTERREFLNIYHSLYKEGLLTWRHDPVAVVEYDLKYGILQPYDGENNKLSLEAMTGAVPGVLGSAVVLLQNEEHQITVYLSGQGGEEDRVWMIYGYEFNKNLTTNNFGNDQVEKAISSYLLTEKLFSWKNRQDSHNFCMVENLKPDQELFPLYIWAYCGEYVIENNKLVMVSGSSGPVKIDYPNELSYYASNKFSYEAPGDGSNYSKDIKRIFPEDVQQKIFAHQAENLIKKTEEYAFANISNWNLIKQAIANCELESVMQTHALAVTATFKDGKKIVAQEPKIDDIFDIINQYKDKCGEIIMATE